MVVEKIPISERLEYKNNVHIRIGEKQYRSPGLLSQISENSSCESYGMPSEKSRALRLCTSWAILKQLKSVMLRNLKLIWIFWIGNGKPEMLMQTFQNFKDVTSEIFLTQPFGIRDVYCALILSMSSKIVHLQRQKRVFRTTVSPDNINFLFPYICLQVELLDNRPPLNTLRTAQNTHGMHYQCSMLWETGPHDSCSLWIKERLKPMHGCVPRESQSVV